MRTFLTLPTSEKILRMSSSVVPNAILPTKTSFLGPRWRCAIVANAATGVAFAPSGVVSAASGEASKANKDSCSEHAGGEFGLWRAAGSSARVRLRIEPSCAACVAKKGVPRRRLASGLETLARAGCGTECGCHRAHCAHMWT